MQMDDNTLPGQGIFSRFFSQSVRCKLQNCRAYFHFQIETISTVTKVLAYCFKSRNRYVPNLRYFQDVFKDKPTSCFALFFCFNSFL